MIRTLPSGWIDIVHSVSSISVRSAALATGRAGLGSADFCRDADRELGWPPPLELVAAGATWGPVRAGGGWEIPCDAPSSCFAAANLVFHGDAHPEHIPRIPDKATGAIQVNSIVLAAS